MRLRSGKIIHITDELSNVNGGSSTNDSIPVTVQSADVTSRSEDVIGMNNFVPPVRFGSVNGGDNSQNPQQYSEYSRDYNVGSTSNAVISMTVYRQQIEESQHDLEGERHDARENNEGFKSVFQNENNVLNRKNPHIVLRGQYADEKQMLCVITRGEVVKIAIMGLGFYMRRKLLNVHILDLAHLAEKVRQTELMKKEKEKYRSEQRSKSKPFTRKEKVAYVTMESSEEELDFEIEIDLAELKKGPPYVCSLLKKLPSNEKSNDSKLKSGKKYSFDISKSYQIFDVLLKDKQVNMVGMSYDFDVALDDFESQVRSVYP
ncbi:hypothetical protein Ahy_A07g034183 [Arachis hypogaea]|uniref:Uncharacterized protein n=1 Tax=Arachis hypogaea TaxID=3818 RepID=A0A445CB45_ARAHY|nr:hypothetical protein Ahy_A07g034183 [Arachis hypogaea]